MVRLKPTWGLLELQGFTCGDIHSHQHHELLGNSPSVAVMVRNSRTPKVWKTWMEASGSHPWATTAYDRSLVSPWWVMCNQGAKKLLSGDIRPAGRGPRTQGRGEEQGRLGLGCLLLLVALAFRSIGLAAGMVKMGLADTAFAAIAVELVSIVTVAIRIAIAKAAVIVFEVVVARAIRIAIAAKAAVVVFEVITVA